MTCCEWVEVVYVLDLFSGIGGFRLGLEQAGMRTVGFCEIDSFCHAVLHKHWPYIPIHNDIRKFDGIPYREAVELVCGGYPCQPFSVAGKQRGAEDERHLWPEMLRIIREVRPRWVIAENVAGHVKQGFDEVAASLEAEDFTVWAFIIPASAVNAPHRRDRLWIIAYANGGDAGQTRNCLPASPEGRAALQTARQRRKRTPVFHRRLSHLSQLAAYTYGKRLQGSDGQLRADQESGTQLPAVLPSFSPEAAVYDELPTPILCGKNDGVSHRTHRLRGLGNAVVPQIVEIIGRAIVELDQQRQPYP